MSDGTAAWLGVIFLVWLFCGLIAGTIAEAKSRSFTGWMLLGFFFGPIALLIISAVSGVSLPLRVEMAQPLVAQRAPKLSIVDELTKLADLKDRGALTDEEFAIQKARLLDG